MGNNNRVFIYQKILLSAPTIILFISALNEFDFNYMKSDYFSFNFMYILIFYWSLKKEGSLGYFSIFIAGLINDVVVGLPIGISSFIYLLICGFTAYLRNITLRPSQIKDWLFFLFTILIVSSINYLILTLIFSFRVNYFDLLINLVLTFLFYFIFSSIFNLYLRHVMGRLDA